MMNIHLICNIGINLFLMIISGSILKKTMCEIVDYWSKKQPQKGKFHSNIYALTFIGIKLTIYNGRMMEVSVFFLLLQIFYFVFYWKS